VFANTARQRKRQGDARVHDRTSSLKAQNIQIAANEPRPFLDTQQTESAVLTRAVHVEPPAIVDDGELSIWPVLVMETDARCARP